MDEYCDKWARHNAGSFYADFDQVWQKDLTGFIERDRNHPCIVIWSLGNEVLADGKMPAYMRDTLKMLVPFAKKLDSTRPYTHASVSGWSDAPGLAALAEVEDVVGVNYQDFLFPQIHQGNPNAILLGTEQDPYLARSGSARPGMRSGMCLMLSAIICGRAWIIWARSATAWAATAVSWTIAFSASHGSIICKASGATNRWCISPSATAPATTRKQPGRKLEPDRAGQCCHLYNCDTVDLYVNSTKIGTKKSSDFRQDRHYAMDGCPMGSRPDQGRRQKTEGGRGGQHQDRGRAGEDRPQARPHPLLCRRE